MGLGQYKSLGEYYDPHTASSVFLMLIHCDLLTCTGDDDVHHTDDLIQLHHPEAVHTKQRIRGFLNSTTLDTLINRVHNIGRST